MGILKKLSGLIVAAAVFAASSLTYAAVAIPPAPEPAVAPVVDVVAGDATGALLGLAKPTLTFTFVEDYAFTSLLLYVDYKPLKMTFDNLSSTAVFNPTGLPSFTLDELTSALGNDLFRLEDTTPGAYSLSVTLLSGSVVLPAGSSLVLTGFFTLDALPLGESTDVAMSGIVTSSVADVDPDAINKFGRLPNDVTGVPIVATVTAVPEPETWLMLLGGLGLIATRVRRRMR